MNTPYTPNLLRRTAVAFAAVAGLLISVPAVAQSSNSLKRSTGEPICTYTGLSVQPNGNVIVTCDTGVVTPPVTPLGESFAITSSPTNLAVNTAALVMVTRTNGTASDVAINYSISGGCSPASGVFWIGQVRPSEGFQIVAPSAAGACTVTIFSPTVGTIGSPGSVTIPVTTSATTTPPVQPGCPTPPNDVLDFELKLSGADRLIMASGRIAAAVLPAVRAAGGVSPSGKIVFGESTISPRAAVVEFSVTKCRGVIDTNAGFCYLRSSNPTFLRRDWIEEPIWGASTDGVAQAYEICRAYQSEGPWYVNVRYSYSASDCQYGNCGFVDQWNYSGW